jgi:hydrogenase nickel incorporation protein HypB
MFHTSTVCVIKKIDLLTYEPINLEKAKDYALKVNPKLEINEVSCTSGEGLEKWYGWLKKKMK